LYDRLSAVQEYAPDGKYFRKSYSYQNGNVSAINYQSNSGTIGAELHDYQNGNLREVKIGNVSVWRIESDNSIGQITSASSGSLLRTYLYYPDGVPLGRKANYSGGSYIQDLQYSLDVSKGNTTWRKDGVRNIQENFLFDGMNRLTSYSGIPVGYDNATGNITSKSDVGAIFSYNDPNNPYAITSILLGTVTPSYTTLPIRNQSVAYTSFDRPEQIIEDNLAATFVYNSSGVRVKMNLTENGSTTMCRYYMGGNYELDVPTSGTSREKLYLGGDYYTAPAVYVKDGAGSWQLFYILRDNLGSITHLVNTSGVVVQELSYDVWGRLRNPANQVPYGPGSEPTLYLGRGYTGHEHLSQFGKINMNARLYDPSVGRFIYPDPVVQSPDNSQNYNRYAYCLNNNPLKYTDPSGEEWWYWGLADLFTGEMTAGQFIRS
jgi:RHS repeat-associated protein